MRFWGFIAAILEAILGVSMVAMWLINFSNNKHSNCLLYLCQIFVAILHIKFIIIGDVWSEYDFICDIFAFDLDYDLDLDVQ